MKISINIASFDAEIYSILFAIKKTSSIDAKLLSTLYITHHLAPNI